MDNNNNISDTQKRIIETTLKMIGINGNLNVTVRDIASEADVNLASINYYFRSKENLFNEVENYFSELILDIEKVFCDKTIPPRDRIIIWANKSMVLYFTYPGIILMVTKKIIQNEKVGYTLGDRVYGISDALPDLVAEITGIEDPKIIAMKCTQITSGMINPIIMQFGILENSGIDFTNSETRNEYITSLVDSILNKKG